MGLMLFLMIGWLYDKWMPVIGAFLFMGAVLFAAIVLGWGDPPS